MKNLAFIIAFLSTALLFSQKIEVKNEKVFIDATAVAKIENKGSYFQYSDLEGIPKFTVEIIKLNSVKSVLRISDGENSNDIENKIYSITLNREKKISENLILGENAFINKNGINVKVLHDFLNGKKSDLIAEHQNRKSEKERVKINDDKVFLDDKKVASLRYADYNKASGGTKLIYTDLDGNDVFIAEEDNKAIRIYDVKNEDFNEIKNTYPKAFNYKKRITESLIFGEIRLIGETGIDKTEFERFIKSKKQDFNQDFINSSVAHYNLYVDKGGRIFAGGIKNENYNSGEEKPYLDNTMVGKIERIKENEIIKYIIRNDKEEIVANWFEKNNSEKEILITTYKDLYNRKYRVRNIEYFDEKGYRPDKDTLALNIIKTMYHHNYKLGDYKKYEFTEIGDEEIEKMNLFINKEGFIYAGGKKKEEYKQEENPYSENTLIGKVEKYEKPLKYIISNAEGEKIAAWDSSQKSESGIPLLITQEKTMYFPFKSYAEKRTGEDEFALAMVKKLYKNSIVLSNYERDDEYIKKFNLYIDNEGNIFAGGKLKNYFIEGENPYRNNKKVGKIIRKTYQSASGKDLFEYEIVDNDNNSVAKWTQDEKNQKKGTLTVVNGKNYPLLFSRNTNEGELLELGKDPMAINTVEKLFKNEIILKNTDPSVVGAFLEAGFSVLYIGLKLAH